jgi:predicted nuclease of predicted toxin-antitoxin system
MKILIDECLPSELKETITVMGRWEVLPTSDRNIKNQQNMTGRSVSIVILRAKSSRMKDLLPLIPACAQALLAI